jgi:gas vesicle protein
MTTDSQTSRSTGFMLGLVTGTFVGAGLALWLVPRAAAEARERVTDAAKAVGDRATARYQQISTRISGAVEDLTDKGLDVRNDAADAIARGAHDVERLATAAKADRR